MTSWTVVYTALPVDFDGEILTLAFASESDAATFKQRGAPTETVSEHVRAAILAELGVRVKFVVRVAASARPPQSAPAPELADAPADHEPAPAVAEAVTGWVVTAIPGQAPAPEEPPADEFPSEEPDEAELAPEPPAAPSAPVSTVTYQAHPSDSLGRQRYGVAVVREVLGGMLPQRGASGVVGCSPRTTRE